MSYHCFQEPVVDCLGHTCLGGDKSDMSSGTTTHSESFGSGLTMESCQTLQFTAISDHSLIRGTPQDIEDWLTSLRVDSPVSHSLPQENNLVKPIQEICGVQLLNVSAWYDQSSRCWKTSLVSLLQDTSEEFSGTWLKAGMIAGGEYYPQPKWALPISEIDYGSLLPTPTVRDCSDTMGGNAYINDRGRMVRNGNAYSIPLNAHVRMCQTPQSRDWKGSSGRSLKGHEFDLPAAVKMYPTPRVQDSRHGAATEWELSSGRNELHIAVTKEMFQSPTVHDANGIKRTEDGKNRSQLNPKWVEWVMGWVPDWTSLNPLGKSVFDKWLNQSISGEIWTIDPSSVPELDTPRLIESGEKDRCSLS